MQPLKKWEMQKGTAIVMDEGRYFLSLSFSVTWEGESEAQKQSDNK